MRLADRIASASLLAFAAFIHREARGLAYWHQYAPGPGFLPFWLSLMLGLAALVLLGQSLTSRAPQSLWVPDRARIVRLGVVVALSVGAAVLSSLVGMVVASGAYMAAIRFYLEPRRVALNVALAGLTAVGVWLVFAYWLAVPLPRGPWGF